MSLPKVNSEGKKELEKAKEQIDAFEQSVKDLTLDRMNANAKPAESEPQTEISQKQLERTKDIYLKPERSLSTRNKFNEAYRKDYEFAKQYVQFIAEHKEIIGDAIEMWTLPFAGMPAEFWRVPTNKPVWGPRYLAEQIKKCSYHRLKTEDKIIGHNQFGGDYGTLVVDTTVQRLDANPVNQNKSIFMGAVNF